MIALGLRWIFGVLKKKIHVNSSHRHKICRCDLLVPIVNDSNEYYIKTSHAHFIPLLNKKKNRCEHDVHRLIAQHSNGHWA